MAVREFPPFKISGKSRRSHGGGVISDKYDSMSGSIIRGNS